ncbi:MAG: nucleoside-diphosphate sugar epimerase [Deltaproteobacteria bacterium]|nr:MAG: nucleoside-diphosphate sugar epimerase [Deltaproteobacteria bacterium]
MNRKKVAVAGATGFVGTAIIDSLLNDYQVRGLTRSVGKISQAAKDDPVEWTYCDVHSSDSVNQALEGVDCLIYLIHSMMPSSRLTQASFQDLDVLIADQFAKSASVNGVKQIIYISGLMPSDYEESQTSKHLESRYEVEQILQNSKASLTTLRCGVIVGPGGSSLKILINLVRRIPLMGLPAWTASMTQPIDINDVERALLMCLKNPEQYKGSFDIGGPDVMTYREMMQTTARTMNRKRIMFSVPIIPISFSKRWVSTFSGVSIDLVGPLVDSLKHDLTVHPNALQIKLIDRCESFEKSLKNSMDRHGFPVSNPRQSFRSIDQQSIRKAKRVRSVQRLPLPQGKNARWVMEEYLRWLPKTLRTILRCEVTDDNLVSFYLRLMSKPLLVLRLDEHGTDQNLVLKIVGGLLANVEESPNGRLEFREVLQGQSVMSAIHDFSPSLPWYLYNITQAVAHLMVMKAFGHHLRNLCDRPPKLEQELQAA